MKKFFEKYREIIVYIGVGLLTTIVSYGVRFAVLYAGAAIFSLDLDTAGSDVTVLRTVAVSLGWIAGVIFGFFTNKSWVFQDKTTGRGAVWAQFGKFVASRLGTYGVELAIGAFLPMLLIALGYKTFHFILDFTPDFFSTCVSIVVVTVLNYVLSKLLVFRKKKDGKDEKDAENSENQ